MIWSTHPRHITWVLSKTSNTRWDLPLPLSKCLIQGSKAPISRCMSIALISNTMRVKRNTSSLNCWRHPLSITVILLRNISSHRRKRKCLVSLNRHSYSLKTTWTISRREEIICSKCSSAIKRPIALCLPWNSRNTLICMTWWTLSWEWSDKRILKTWISSHKTNLRLLRTLTKMKTTIRIREAKHFHTLNQ